MSTPSKRQSSISSLWGLPSPSPVATPSSHKKLRSSPHVSPDATASFFQDLEDKILHLLATSTGNILDDEDLINTLDNSKIISTKTAEAVKGAEQTSAEIEVAQEAYRPVATRGSILYFVVSDFGSVDPMYQYSLAYFKEIFAKTVTDAEKSDELEKRIAILVEATTRTMFVMICRGLFEQHKGLFAFLIAVSIMRQKKVVSPDEWAFFLKPALAQEGLPPNPSGDGGWLELKVWGSVIGGEKDVQGLAGLRAALEADAAPWRAYAESDAPQNAPLPALPCPRIFFFSPLEFYSLFFFIFRPTP